VLSITWIGHASVLIEVGGVRVLTDPVLGPRVGPLVRVAPAVAPFAAIDAVLISHLHGDHVDLPSLRRVASPLVVAPRGAGGWLRRQLRGGEVVELEAGDAIGLDGVRVEATPAEHDERRWPVGVRAKPLGFVVSAPVPLPPGPRALGAGAPQTVYFAGDTDIFPEMEQLAGRIDVALLPVAGWGPKLGPGHLDPARAAAAAALIAPRVAIPIHWGTLAPPWPLKRHPEPARPPREFAELVAREAPAVEVRVLEPGERTVVG
jgi:L-ascorbate metabolism protein UlaG (beta-lactamase superfamily)